MANGQLATYSGQDLTGSISFPGYGVLIPFAGVNKAGLEQVNVRMGIDHAMVKEGMDGSILPTWKPGEWGEIEIDVWQTSELHAEILNLYNLILAASSNGDVSNTFSGQILVANSVDGSSHNATGCSIKKVPDKTYQGEAQRVAWVFVCCNIISQTLAV